MAQVTRSDVTEAFVEVLQHEFPGHFFSFTPVLYDPDSFSPYSILYINKKRSSIRLNIVDIDGFRVKAEKELLNVLCDKVEQYFKSIGIASHRDSPYNLAIGSKVELV